ncbi:hypothetical protein [Accumulibacter sp.]|uniref:hypothetical protein n=1 Tax=Accumulibacter sp. TaxID=2053492 RepID=UPI0025EE353A|nr:hypothetical protein [Accumulibacter sp.]MCM8596461.1 hypothetical protein [Accumulibacter sp.]MCM8627367.1 hypothetical protein [Accumulibacter sp.]MDS4050610.1 hypothetical protein [Accumulibacter sp.]
MGDDPGLVTLLADVALVVVVAAVLLGMVAWRVRRRRLRLVIAAGLFLLGVVSAVVFGLIGMLVVWGLGAATLIAGLRTPPSGLEKPGPEP